METHAIHMFGCLDISTGGAMGGPTGNVSNKVYKYDDSFQSVLADFSLGFIHQYPDLSVVVDPAYQPSGFLSTFPGRVVLLEVISNTELKL